MKIQRRMKILNYINERGMVKNIELLKKFNISKATLNRDLTDLERQGQIQKIHGGVISNGFQLTYEPLQNEKESAQKEYKQLIAKEAIKQIKNGMTITLDSGTTSLALANEIKKCDVFDKLIVITNDLKVGMAISENPKVHLIVLGGQKRKDLYSLTGLITEKALDYVNADLFFLCVDAFDVEKGVSNANLSEVAIKKRMIDTANKVILLADHTKLNKVKLAKVCSIEEIDMIITDYRVTDEEQSRIRAKCENLIIAKE